MNKNPVAITNEIFQGYELKEMIHQSYPYTVYRAVRVNDDTGVCIKTFTERLPSKEQLLEIQREYSLTKKLEIQGVINFHELVWEQKRKAGIVMEAFGISLKEYLASFKNRKLPLQKFFEIAPRLVHIVGLVHESKIIHKKIEPSNILINPESGEIKLIDFSLASELTNEHTPGVSLASVTAGSIGYVSPEQTGRINRDIDYRSDYYSLGIIFYQMLTGDLPFTASDSLEWVYSTISKKPISPGNKNPEIPNTLSEIILKLIAKNAEDRYQSSRGITVDLNKCYDQFKKGNTNYFFIPGQSDISRKFQISPKLYGREKELEKLGSYFERTALGSTEFCLVSGYTGVGKTALVSELSHTILNKNGYLIQGKFEQYRQNAPYWAVGKAFGSLMLRLLGEPGNRLADWKKEITDALDNQAQLIIEIIPELELIIGKQEPVPALSIDEAQNRFLMLFITFVKVFANEKHPLVVFLDDLQWSDTPTLHLIQRLVNSEDLNHLFIIGAFRDNEVDAAHPLSITLREIQKKRFVENLELKPISKQATKQLINDTLLCTDLRSEKLSDIVFEKTRGNPFFTIELLKSLKERDIIFFNASNGSWEWDINVVLREKYTDNVIDILVANQNRLTKSTQKVLQLAACIGTTFDLKTLAIIKDIPLEKIGTKLHLALAYNMIQPLNDEYKFLNPNSVENNITTELPAHINPVYKFQHDRVQQAAYSQLTAEKKEKLHLSIGRIMLQHSEQENFDEKLMEIVGHLNEGRRLIRTEKERLKLGEYNLSVGIKAKQSSAYQSALEHLQIGKELLGERSWQKNYQLTWNIYFELQQSFYLTGKWNKADEIADILLNESKSEIEKGLILSARTRQYSTTKKMKESITSAVEGLSILGFEFKTNPTTEDVDAEVKKINQKLDARAISTLIDLPEMENQKAKIASQLIMEIFPAAFLSASGEMFPYLVLKSVNIALDYGNSPETAFSFAAYGMLLCGFFNKPARGYEFGKLGVNLIEKFENISLKARILYVYTMFVHHWSNHWSSMTDWFRKGIEAGYQSGDLLYLAYSAQDCIIWDPQLDLEAASKEHRKLLDIVKRCEYQDSLDSGTLFLQMQLNFQGLTQSLYSLTDDDFDEIKCFEGMQQRHFMTGISNYHIYKAEIHLLYNDATGALKHIIEQEKLMTSVMALPQNVRFHMVSFLVRSILLPSLNPNKQAAFLSKMNASHKMMSDWAAHCPENFEHLKLLMEAELANFEGDSGKSLMLYERSIEAAQKQSFIRDEAVANEMAGRMMLRTGFRKAAVGYLREAHYLFYNWGAHRKVEEMEKYYSGIELSIENNKIKRQSSGTENSETQVIDNDLMDLSSVIKASQTISGELVLDKLLNSTLEVIIENAGAQKGFLVNQKDGEIVIQAQIFNESENQNNELSIKDSEGIPVLPITLVSTVLRTNQPIIIDNASEINSFSSDPYFRNRKPLSVICVPLPKRGEWTSAVYLENNLTHSVFTNERIEVIKLLAGQASISIENARIYEQQEKLLKAQQRFVPIQFLKHLGHNNITSVELGQSVSMEMSVLFTDIFNFTPLVEQQTPQTVIHFLNRLYNQLGKSIMESNGFIDSYAGDGIMALFAVPANRAVSAGINMCRELYKFNRSSGEMGMPPIRLGIGINSGPLVLGTMGSNNRMQCSVLGDTVNLASRIEQLTRLYGARLLIGENTYLQLENKENLTLRMVDFVAVKGKGKAVKLYEVLDAETDECRLMKEKTHPLLNEGLDAYFSRDFNSALNIFSRAQQLDSTDPVLSIFYSRAQRYVETPPPADWAGFENFEHK